jgi:hypothetical protein
LYTILTLDGVIGDKAGKEYVMSSITVESIFNQIVQLPPPERIKLWQLLEKLKEREPVSQETQGTPQPSKKNRPQTEPMRDYKTELQWIADHAREYKGQWVALDGSRLIAHGAKADEVFDAAEADGANQPLVGFVDDPDKIYAGF